MGIIQLHPANTGLKDWTMHAKRAVYADAPSLIHALKNILQKNLEKELLRTGKKTMNRHIYHKTTTISVGQKLINNFINTIKYMHDGTTIKPVEKLKQMRLTAMAELHPATRQK